MDGCKSFRSEFYSNLDSFPLLKNRLFSLHKSFNSPENIEKAFNKHKQKINWHLRRIYRIRGLIIHSGKHPSYTPILIENLHTYIDILLKRLIELFKSRLIETIEQGVFETTLAYEFQLSLIKKHKGETLTHDNFKEALLGKKK